MLTRKRWTAPNYTGDAATDYRNLTKSISDYLLSLEDKGSLAISEAQITANQGIAFPATQVASSNVNTLDDYEEGTFNGGISFGGGTTGITYASQACSYTKIGNRVHCSGFVYLSSKGSSTGAAKLTGFPFTVRNNSDSYSALSVYYIAVSFANQHQAFMDLNATTASLNEVTEAGTATNLTDANFANDSQVFFSVTYQVA